MGFGATATLEAPYIMYAIVIVLALMRFPLLFFVGGYVAHSPLPALPSAFVSIAGITMNVLLWFIFRSLIKYKIAKRKYWNELALMAKLNLFLAAFNMLPIPGFDGFNFFRALFGVFG
jgi:Zn-dependent protease